MGTARRARPCRHWQPALRLIFLLLLAAGCQSKGDVSGKVSYHGKAVVFGTVLFEGSDGSLRQSNIERDGNYSVKGVATGTAKVAVTTRNPKSSDFMPLQRDGGKPLPPRPDIPEWFAIPDKYDAPYTSGLTYTVHGGENKFDIVLE